MRFKASEFRYCNILPNPLIDIVIRTGLKFSGIVFGKDFDKHPEWYKFERHIEVLFGEQDPQDATAHIGATCGSCGKCCTKIPDHQIGIYMSPTEINLARQAGHKVLTQGAVKVGGVTFSVLQVTPEGDCAMLRPDGCSLGDLKPLWCKIYHCSVFQGRPYDFDSLHTPIDKFLGTKK